MLSLREIDHQEGAYSTLPRREAVIATVALDKKKPLLPKRVTDAIFIQDLIDAKKKKRAIEQSVKPLVFSISLVLSLLVAIVAIEWKSYDDNEVVMLTGASSEGEELMDIVNTVQPPPPPPVKRLQQPNIVEAEDVEELMEDIELDFDVDINSESVVEAPQATTNMKMEEEVEEEVFMIVEKQPEPVGGMAAFMKYIYENVHYPRRALEAEVEGKVFVQFIVNKDGSLVDIQAVRGIGKGCDEEAVKVVQNAPKWIPGKQRGKPVRVRMIIPIRFVYKQR